MDGGKGVILTPNPYTESVNKKRLSSTGSYVQDSPGSRKSLTRTSDSYNNNVNVSHASLRSASNNSKLSIYHLSQDIKPENGCIQLGREGTSGNKYTTRFKIDTAREREAASEGVFLEECCLCSVDENRTTVLRLLKAIVMSEAFLLTFHLGALSLGVIKTSIHREHIDEDLELIHSIIELLAVTFVLFSRFMLVRESLQDVIKRKKANQHLEIGASKYITGKHLRTLVLGFTIMCIVFDLLAIFGFLIFYYFVHLGWTTLLNNALLIIATVVSNLVLKKLQKVRTAIGEDEHKVVLYESTLLLKEGLRNMSVEDREAYNKTVMTFMKSLFDTNSFKQPSHIELKEKYGPRWNAVTTMEMFSSI